MKVFPVLFGFLVGCFLGLGLWCDEAYADGTAATAEVEFEGTACPGGWPNCIIPVSEDQTSSGPFAADASAQMDYPATLGIGAHSSISNGNLDASANANVGWLAGGNFAIARATLDDTITTFGPATTGVMVISIFVGTFGFDAGEQADAFTPGGAVTFPGFGSESVVLSFPFTLGSSFNISADVGVGAVDQAPLDPGFGESDGFAFVNFTSLQFFDSNGQPVSDFAYSDTSGMPYNFLGATETPEPISVVLLGSGMLFLVGTRLTVRRRGA